MEVPYAGDIQKALRSMTEKLCTMYVPKQYGKLMTYTKRLPAVRQYKERLGFSEQWMSEYVYNIVLLAKRAET